MAKSEGGHIATWAKDRRNGGYLVRVMGPKANMFGERRVDDGTKEGAIKRRVVPVRLKNGDMREVTLGEVVWTGKDDESGLPVALYTHIPEELEQQDEIPF